MVVASFVIALREGIEAALVVAIMLTYLKKSNQWELKKYVAYGTVAALVSSISVAAVMAILWGILEGPILAFFEGTVVIIATVLLTTMILWMWRAGPGIATEIEESVQRKTMLQSGIGLTLLAMALVLREGVELVLFTLALAFQDGVEAYFGVTFGLITAIVIGYGLYQGSLRISLRFFFNWTSVLLVLFAAGMLAYGIHELQEAELLLIGPLEIWDINPPLLSDGSYPLLHEKGLVGGFAKALLGYNGNPSALEVVAYFAYLTIIVSYYLFNRRRSAPASP